MKILWRIALILAVIVTVLRMKYHEEDIRPQAPSTEACPDTAADTAETWTIRPPWPIPESGVLISGPDGTDTIRR